MRQARSRIRHHRGLFILWAALLVLLLPGASAHAQERRVTVTLAKQGDRFADTMHFKTIARATRDGQRGYEVTYHVSNETITLFWSRDQIRLRGRARVRLQSIPLPGGRLRYPDVITAESLPEVHEEIVILERDYARQAHGLTAATGACGLVIVAAEAFGPAITLGAAMPSRHAWPPARPRL